MRIYYIITIGCQMNKNDSERVAGYLSRRGWRLAENYYQADLIVVNTCGVRQSAEDRVYGLIPRLKRVNRQAKIILTGCLVYREDVKKKIGKKVDAWLPITELPHWAEKIEKNEHKKDKHNSDWKVDLSLAQRMGVASGKDQGQDYLKIKPKYSSRFKAFVPIGNGCNNFCAYCVVPYARGREVYRPAEEIIGEIKDLVNKNYKEITLIAQNVNSYQYNMNQRISIRTSEQANKSRQPRKINFPTLLKMANDIKGDFRLRFATSHPKDMSDELIAAMATKSKICEHIHLPVQAGDDEVLRRMNRGYTIAHYKNLIKKIRRVYKKKEGEGGWRLPPAITTDVIVGFPGETEEQFNNTIKLFQEMKFDMAYIAQYSPRPGTAAAEMADDVPDDEKKRREKELTAILRRTARANNEKYVGLMVEILIEGKNKKGEWFGHTRTNKNVKIKKAEILAAGQIVKVEITSAKDFGLEGKIKERG